MTNDSRVATASNLLQRYWALGLLALMASSYRLWTPGLFSGFPNVELLPPFGIISAWSDWILTPALLICCVSVLAKPNRWPWAFVALLLVLGFATDQHRMQPWAYQIAIFSLLFCLASPHSTSTMLRWISISIYAYSAAGKLADQQFMQTVGQQFLDSALHLVGHSLETMPEQHRPFATQLFPLGEIVIAILLLIPRTRRAGGIMAIMMHATLIVLLGPFGLNHSTGVLVWNLLLGGQAYLLFVRWDSVLDIKTSQTGSPENMMAWTLTILILVLPISERAGYWDHWLSWALYSPHNSRVDVQLHQSAIDQAPPSIQASLEPDDNDDGWHDWNLGRWSLNTRGVPILPQARYQLALIWKTCQQEGWVNQVRGIQKSSSDRRTGQRTETFLLNVHDFRKAMDQYWFVPQSSDADVRK